MEPDVMRLYSSSPPPLEDGAAEEEDDEFSDFTGVPNSVSFTEFETPTTFNQLQALNATSPPELIGNGRIVGLQSPALSNGGQQDAPACKTVSVGDLKNGVFTNFSDVSGYSRSGAVDCNGGVGGNEALTNGFVTFESCRKRREAEAIPSDDSFADFAAFSNADASNRGERLARDEGRQREDGDGDTTGFASVIEASDCLSNGDWGFHEGTFVRRDQETDDGYPNSNPDESLSADDALDQDSLEVKDKLDSRVSPISVEDKGSSGEPTEDKGSGNETETETETSFGRPLSTEALEEFGDFSTTGSVPSPPLQEETVTPADHSQLAEDDEDFGDFGDAGSFGGFADFDQQGADPETSRFGDFDSHGQPSEPGRNNSADQGAQFSGVPGSDSFADFASAPADDAWQAFGEPDSTEEAPGSWAAFGQDHGSEQTDDDWHEGHSVTLSPPTGSSDECRRDSVTVALVSRLEKLFLASFPEVCAPPSEDDVPPLRSVLDPKPLSDQEQEDRAPADRTLQTVWQKLQDIHNALGLRHQWGGSYSNKALLCSLGIDTRNILFTGQKKQPVIVPMYAASLGMLEPTKEPVKPVSAAEMIASIAQSPSVSTEMSTCPGDAAQESLPPVQFDWSSSGLTNPLDGVDPELYELTQAKLEVSGGSSKVADAFARLMSTVEKTNTSTRRAQAQREENLSEEARRVISTLPDLSFMQAKVLMFPSTLTPLPLSTSSSPSPVPD